MSSYKDTMAALLKAQHAEEAQKKKDAYMQKRVDEFLQNNKLRVKDFIERNPGKRLPVYYLEQEDRVVWLNRKQARMMEKNLRRGRDLLGRSISRGLTAKRNKSVARQKVVADEQTTSARDATGTAQENSNDQPIERTVHAPSIAGMQPTDTSGGFGEQGL